MISVIKNILFSFISFLFSRFFIVYADGLYECPACGGNCEGGDCEDFVTTDCVDEIELCESELCTLIYSCVNPEDTKTPFYSPDNWEDTADYEAMIAAGATKINIIGDIAEPTQETITISKRRKKQGPKQFIVNFDIDEWTVANYEKMRKWECGATIFIWLQTLGGVTLGGATGIRIDITKANSPFLRGENQYKKLLFTGEWDSKCHPPATDKVELL